MRVFCVLGLFVFSVGAILAYNAFMMTRNVDFLFEHVLGEGDPDATYRNGDPVFQTVYTRDAFRRFAEEKPELFQRDKVTGREVVWRKQKSRLFVVLKAEVNGDHGACTVEYYCQAAGANQWRLVGIEPGLDAAIPKKLLKISE